MKCLANLFYLLLFCTTLRGFAVTAQDTLTVLSVSEEMETNRKQRFIDRYENVFMTKEPTKHMVKLGLAPFVGGYSAVRSDQLLGTFLNLYIGYEYKLNPSISVGLAASGSGGAYRTTGMDRMELTGSVNFSAQIRWYYDMKKRMKEGLSANNFSGNYIALVGENNFEKWRGRSGKTPIVGIEYGIQRRFFNRGFIDFGIGVYRNFEGTYRTWRVDGPVLFTPTHKLGSEWNLRTRATLGLAFGDWKRKSDLPFCEVLRCDEVVKSQFTIAWPGLNFGLFEQSVSGGVGFEQKIAPSLSIKTQVGGYLYSLARDTGPRSTLTELFANLQLRYYLFQRSERKRGRGGNDLSGFYLGPHTEYLTRSNRVSGLMDSYSLRMDALRVGFVTGYQKTLFKNAYIDVSWALSGNAYKSLNFYRSASNFQIGFGLRF